MKITTGNGILLIIIFTLICVSGCCNLKKDCLTVRGGKKVAYQCENSDRIAAKHYSLSDGSLNFVKVTLPDGREQTLPQGLSASGARYTDEREFVWWIKGDSARLEIRDEEGNWQTRYSNCKVLP